MPATLVIGHFPPPIHGQAVATSEFAALGHALGQTVLSVDTSGPAGSSRPRYLLCRIGAWGRVATVLVQKRKSFAVAHFGVDADSGLPVTLLLALVAKRLGYSVRLQHHSFRYLTRSRRVAKLGFSALGTDTEHVVTCDKMAIALRRAYGTQLRCSVVSVAYAIKPAETVRETAAAPRTIGTLGNLGAAKSLDIVIDTFGAVSTTGELRLALGGPIVDAEAKEWLAEATERHGDRIAWAGPLSGHTKDEFLAGMDIFLFPSRHLDESFGLVVMEALQMGVPVIMVPNLCMGGTELGTAGLAITEIDDFSALAADQITMWQREPVRYQQAQNAARSLAKAHIAIASGAAASLWTDITPSNHEARMT